MSRTSILLTPSHVPTRLLARAAALRQNPNNSALDQARSVACDDEIIARDRPAHRRTPMAGLRFAVLITTTSAVLLLLAASATSSPPSRPPAVHVVAGDEVGWVPPGGAAGALNDWAARHRFLVDDVLDFKYSNGDAVLLVRPGDYERCSAARPVSRFADGGGGGTRFVLGRPGLFYFISGAPARCEAGHRMAVRVVDADARRRSLTSGAPTPAPAPAPAPGTQLTSDTPHRRPLSLAQKQFAAAAIGFGAGFILIYFIMFLCVCCGS